MSNLKDAVEKSLKEVNGLSAAVRDYGEKALAAIEKKVGQQPDEAEAEALVKYCDNVLVMVRRAQGKLVESMTGGKGSGDKKVEVSSEEKWLFFHRYEMYVLALSEEAASRL